MPYMPTNFYPKNCAITLDRGSSSKDVLTFSADLDKYDVIYEAAIDIYNYYSKELIGSIILCPREKDLKSIEVEGVKKEDNKTINIAGYSTKVEIFQKEKDSIDFSKSYCYYTNDIEFPLKNGKEVKFSFPLKKYALTNIPTIHQITYSKDSALSRSYVLEGKELLPALQESQKFVWTLAVLNSSGVVKGEYAGMFYDTWVSDGYIESVEVGSNSSKIKIYPNEKITSVSVDKKKTAITKDGEYFQNQIIYNEKNGLSHSFILENGTGYYDKTGEALNLCWSAKVVEAGTTDEIIKRFAVFDRVLDVTDHTGKLIVDNPKRNTVNICSVNENEEIKIENKKVGYTGDFIYPEDISLTIDVYDMKVEKIYTHCYYNIDETNNRLYFYSGGVYVDEQLNPISFSQPSTMKPTAEAKKYKGPVTIVEYLDPQDLIPLSSTSADGIYNENNVLIDSSVEIDDETYYLRFLSGQYLNLKRNLMTCTVGNAKSGGSAFAANDFYQIRCNYVTSSPNYFETISTPRIYINKAELQEEIELAGPARSFVGEIENLELEWSYWELKKITMSQFGDILGEELILITEKDYSKDIRFEYYGFLPTEGRDYYSLTLYAKDRRGLVASSKELKVKVKYNSSLGENNQAQVRWNEEKQGIEIDYSSLVGINGQIVKGEEVSSGVPNKDFYIESYATENEKYQKSLAYLVMGDDVDSILFKGNEDQGNVLSYEMSDYDFVFGFQAEQEDHTGDFIRVNDNLVLSLGRDDLFINEKTKTVSGGDYILIKYKDDNGESQEDKFYIYDSSYGYAIKKYYDDKNKEQTDTYTLGYSPNIIRSENIEDYSKLYYLNDETNYNFTENAVFCFYDLFKCNSEIIGALRSDENGHLVFYMQFKRGDYLINWKFTTSKKLADNANTFSQVSLFNGFGYSFAWIAKKLENSIVAENGYLSEKISNFEFDWKGYETNEGQTVINKVVFYSHFYLNTYDQVTLTVSSADISDLGGSYSNVVIYRYCYETEDSEKDARPIKTLLISGIYAPMKKIYDYSVDNHHWYSYRIIPLYYDDKGVLSSIGVISTDKKRIKPEYYNTTVYGVSNNYNDNNVYYFNPYVTPNGKWSFELDVQGDDITFTSESSVSAGAAYAKVAKSDVMYMQSSITAKLGAIKDEVVYERDDYLSLKKLRDFLQSSSLKMIRLKNGMCIPVETQIKSSKTQSNLVGSPTDITFEWYQIQDEDNFFLYEPYLTKREEFLDNGNS